MKKNQPKMFDGIEDKYDPALFEEEIYSYWLKKSIFLQR